MGLDQYAHLRGKEYDFDKYNNDKSGTDNNQFYWRKHARLQHFMSDEHRLQNKDYNPTHPLGHLGFNSDADTPYVLITSVVLDKLEKAIEEKYYRYFAPDGYFWGQQFQEEQMKAYREQDLEFIKWAKEQIKNGKEVVYECSW